MRTPISYGYAKSYKIENEVFKAWEQITCAENTLSIKEDWIAGTIDLIIPRQTLKTIFWVARGLPIP